VIKIESVEKQTTPPPRYSQGSILKEMEARNLGTKATRPQILQILYDRGYIVGKSIEVTDLGINLINILEKNVPLIISEDLTRKLEEDCDSVQSGKKKREYVLNEAKKIVTEICKEFKQKEKDIGTALTKALISSHDKQSILGECPKCGGTLRILIMRGKGTRFVGCENYKKGCKFSAPLPKMGTIIPTGKKCEHCNTPIIQVSRPGTRPFRMCLDIHCDTKKDWLDKRKIKNMEVSNVEEKSKKTKSKKKIRKVKKKSNKK
jgi:DNA topoisomerase-1